MCERGIGGPPLSSLYTPFIASECDLDCNAIWIVLMVCFSSCRIDFLIAELVKLLSISFIKLCHFIGYMLEYGSEYDPIMLYITCIFISSVILLVIYWRSSSNYDLIMLYLACLFNNELLKNNYTLWMLSCKGNWWLVVLFSAGILGRVL